MKNRSTSSNNGRLARRLATHFAALALPAFIIPAAQAQIVHSGLVNINIPSTTAGVYLNVVTGAAAASPAGAPGWDVNPWASTSLSFFTSDGAGPAASRGYVVGLGSSASLTDNLPLGYLIDAGSIYGTGVAGAETTGSTAFLLSSSDNLVGFRFQNELNGNQVHYGWMRLSLSAGFGTQPRSIVEYAYESTAGVGIGAGIIPEPTAASLLLLGLGGLLGVRSFRRN